MAETQGVSGHGLAGSRANDTGSLPVLWQTHHGMFVYAQHLSKCLLNVVSRIQGASLQDVVNAQTRCRDICQSTVYADGPWHHPGLGQDLRIKKINKLL